MSWNFKIRGRLVTGFIERALFNFTFIMVFGERYVLFANVEFTFLISATQIKLSVSQIESSLQNQKL